MSWWWCLRKLRAIFFFSLSLSMSLSLSLYLPPFHSGTKRTERCLSLSTIEFCTSPCPSYCMSEKYWSILYCNFIKKSRLLGKTGISLFLCMSLSFSGWGLLSFSVRVNFFLVGLPPSLSLSLPFSLSISICPYIFLGSSVFLG